MIENISVNEGIFQLVNGPRVHPGLIDGSTV